MIRALLLPVLLFLAGCFSANDAPTGKDSRVNAADYDAYWLWAGVQPQPVLDQAKTLYILEAELQAVAPGVWQSRLANTPRTNAATVWITYRVETLRWTPDLYDRLPADVARWRAAGNRVTGVQIDFDAKTQYLNEYAAFLSRLRRKLPPDIRISITGLLDWGANGDPDALNALAQTVDDIVLQTYQGRTTIPGYQAYLDQLGRMRVPFRIGLVQGGEWAAPSTLARNPYFRGYVVFLVNPAAKSKP